MNEVSRNAERKSRAEWEALMAAYEAGDLPQREFCEVNGVAYSTFGYWRQRLRTAAVDTTASLLDVSSLVQREDDTSWRVEIELSSGVCLRLR